MAANTETITFNGIIFRRYPDSPRWVDRVYFTPGIADRQAGVGRLHEEMWKAEHGPIPDGHEIHHIDFDPSHNDLENFECLSSEEHAAIHRQRSSERGRSPERLKRLNDVRPKASAWHRSDAGHAWHSDHARRQWAERTPDSYQCDQCGTAFESTTVQGNVRFCSNKCKSAWRRASGLDDVERHCEACGQTFTVNKYDKARTCSRVCGAQLANAKRQARREAKRGT